MSGAIRLSLCAPGATAAELIGLGRQADRWNIGGLWIGDPYGRASNADDNYVTTTAAAVSAVTTDLRLGLVLGLADEKQLPRLAEDVAVIDQASAGRVELALRDTDDGWLARAARFLNAWHAWELPGRNETVAVLPSPAQPLVPRVVVADESAADALDAGRMLLSSEPPPDRLVARRRLLVLSETLQPGQAREWIAGGAYAVALQLREQAVAAGARELVLLVDPSLEEEDLLTLATVYAPSLRASDRNVRGIASDALQWLTQKRHLHSPPERSNPATK